MTQRDPDRWPVVELKRLARETHGLWCLHLSLKEQAIALAVYREIARGAPAEVSAIARRAGVQSAAVEAALERWPGVERGDGRGSVVGFWGLALGETPHAILCGGTALYAWCAWDTLFLGELLAQELRVESACAVTDQPVSMLVGGKGVRELDPPGATVSFPEPAGCDVRVGRPVRSCCQHMQFFASPGAWKRWASGRSSRTLPLAVEDGWRLGKITNRMRYGGQL